ncbi:MAG: hypothetical protein J6W11_00885 [Alphaproteobacteria bacterium]|nr:hypothetical protein [Alphaproteobacteria bacterium]MBO7097178.1 hypothetical protein [Alphaproteobacteria bacterium]
MDFLLLVVHKAQTFLSNPENLQTFVGNRFFMILLVIVLLKAKYAVYSNIYMCALVNIVGTFLHEMSHFIVGLILNAHPTGFTIFPQKRGDVYVTGSVCFKNIKFYNALPSALAPIMLLFLGYYLNKWFFANIEVTYVTYILYILLQTIIIENAMPSSTDFKVAFSYPLGVLFYASIAVAAIIVM